jgi:NAD+ synthase (glutamine-hydrolysing)
MSHYNVNGGVPKTLIQHLIRWVISTDQFEPEVCEVLQSVLDTEITPELVPSGEEEELQSSEAQVGPFALQDFSLFYVLRFGFRPSKIAFLAWQAWSDPEQGNWPPGFPEGKRPSYSLKEIRHWLGVFVQRFYAFSQFKRSALPNGPKVSHGGSLSPRGDWRAPSDMSARIWLDEIEREVPDD